MIYYLVGCFLFKRLVFWFSKPVEDNKVTVLWHEVKDKMNISANITLFTCKKVQGPMMSRFFKLSYFYRI
jgi:hypothetical protein